MTGYFQENGHTFRKEVYFFQETFRKEVYFQLTANTSRKEVHWLVGRKEQVHL
jgi:hypothetical protein